MPISIPARARAFIRLMPFASGMLLCSSFLEAQAGSKASRLQAQRTWAADSFWVRDWFRGGTKEPELFTEPRFAVVSGDVVVVLDMGLREVTGLDIRTGATRFTLAARGEGPGEFRRPFLLVSAPNGFALLDQATSRLSAFDNAGRMRWDMPIKGAAGVEGVCFSHAGRLLVKTNGARGALTHYDTSGRTVSVKSLPWRDPGAKAAMVSSVVSGPDARGSCVLARRYGSEWLALLRNGTFVRHAYIATHPDAIVAVKDSRKQRDGDEGSFVRTQTLSSGAAVTNVMMRGDSLIVRGGPAERDGYRTLDYYLLPSGRYLFSRRLPAIFIATAATADGGFVGTSIGEEAGAIIAFRPTRIAPRKATTAPTPDSTRRQPGSRPVSR